MPPGLEGAGGLGECWWRRCILSRKSEQGQIPNMEQTCICGKKYWPKQAWIHAGCASNNASNRLPSASNNEHDAGVLGAVHEEGRSDVVSDVPGVSGVGVVESKQRWSRDAYNAYQREYMRKRRSGT